MFIIRSQIRTSRKLEETLWDLGSCPPPDIVSIVVLMILKYFSPDDKKSLIEFVSMHIDQYHVEESCPIFFFFCAGSFGKMYVVCG